MLQNYNLDIGYLYRQQLLDPHLQRNKLFFNLVMQTSIKITFLDYVLSQSEIICNIILQSTG